MSEHTALTTGEFERTMTALREDIREGFDRVTDRQDVANGRTNLLEATQSAHIVKLKNLERELFERPRLVPAPDAAGAAKGITLTFPTDAKTIAALLLAVGGLIVAMAKGWLS